MKTNRLVKELYQPKILRSTVRWKHVRVHTTLETKLLCHTFHQGQFNTAHVSKWSILVSKVNYYEHYHEDEDAHLVRTHARASSQSLHYYHHRLVSDVVWCGVVLCCVVRISISLLLSIE